ncbi:MAG: hypothetical protein AAF773_09110 [Cyanobacteria bacterium P01_D01_bin.115]
MASSKLRDRLSRYFELWALRFIINLFKFSLTTTLAGTLVFAVLLAHLLMTTGEGPLPSAAVLVQWAVQGFNFILFSVTGGGDFEGGITELGELVMAFATPYLMAISIVVSIAETLIGKSLFHWLRWSHKSRLIFLLAVFGLLMSLSVGASNLSATEVPYWLRIVILSLLGGWAVIVLLLLHSISLKAEQNFRRYRDQVLS